ncbi:low-density lipoprotein receptor-like [Ptychodera flava]|uniref:low-density lipoprotein receptor-like n=1 Tax=Ptychodera flava TaxID=63121 RepID=UPI00396A25E3
MFVTKFSTACKDSSWGRHENVCFKPEQRNRAEEQCSNLDTDFKEINRQELQTISYYLSHVWSINVTGYILLVKDIAVNDDVIELIGGDCATAADNKNGCYIGVNKDKQIADNFRACLGMDASDWTVRLMDCDEEIALEMCMTQASVTTHTCGVEAFECAGNECIHSVYVCDGNTDCINGSDEIGCNMAVACPTNTFRCENGKCVSMTFYCDFIDHCGDDSDEEACVYPNCTVDQFKCDNNQCVHKSKHCDLMEDCYDGSDEKYCDVCKGFLCYYVDFIPEHAQCDGELDCAGIEREDETDCDYGGTVSSSSEEVDMPIESCSVEEFRCLNGPCVDRKWMCIYDFDQYGYQRGCRDVTHLRNCGTLSKTQNIH